MSEALKFAAATLGLLVLGGAAHAQSGAPTDCSGTVGTNSTAIIFPSAGNHGPPSPQKYLTITNPSQTASLALNPNGAAAIDSAGSLPMDVIGSGWTWAAPDYPPPAQVNIIASTSSTPFSCKYN